MESAGKKAEVSGEEAGAEQRASLILAGFERAGNSIILRDACRSAGIDAMVYCGYSDAEDTLVEHFCWAKREEAVLWYVKRVPAISGPRTYGGCWSISFRETGLAASAPDQDG